MLSYQPLLDLMVEPFDDIYSTDAELLDVQGQIEELVTLSRRFDFEGVAVLVYVNELEVVNELILAKVKELFGWLTPLQFEGFAIKAALPEKIVQQAQLIERTRGRVSFASIDWSIEQCRDIGNRHLRVATDHQLGSLAEIATVELLNRLEREIQTLYGAPSPRGWLWLTATLLNGYTKNNQKLTVKRCEELIRTYFANYVPLKIDKARKGVWRGVNFIPLDDQPFSFLEVLWQNRDLGDANQALFRIAGSQGNLNTIASRLRKKIEPVPKQPVYLRNTRSQGYWLENVVDLDSWIP